jgi:4-amino-4-deoxy-L-arabinose transferase-like glycosyltransferase
MRDTVLLAILCLALLCRLYLASTVAYIHDEDRTAIPLSQTISFAPGHLNLPLRGENHGALPAYLVKASGSVFGASQAGYRALHVLFGLGLVALMAHVAGVWFGPVAARWTAAILAFNEYFLTISSRATAHVPHLFLLGTALYAFSRFLATQRAAFLYGAGAAVGLAFYCKEHSALLLPVFFLALLHPTYRPWLRRVAPYGACALFLLLIAPDVLWNARTNPNTARVAYSDAPVGQSTYGNHLKRVGGLGFSPYPSMFYGYSVVQAAHLAVTGREVQNDTPEYQPMNATLGALMFAAVALSTIRWRTASRLEGYLLIAFWFVFAFFTLIKKGESVGRLDAASWIWVESTLMPATLLTAARLSEARGTARLLSWTVATAALVFAAAAPLRGLSRELMDAAIETRSFGSHTMQVLALTTVDAVRSRPLLAVIVTLAVGVALGLALGFAAGWAATARSRRRDR